MRYVWTVTTDYNWTAMAFDNEMDALDYAEERAKNDLGSTRKSIASEFCGWMITDTENGNRITGRRIAMLERGA